MTYLAQSPAQPVTTTYSASGAIALTDTVSNVSATSGTLAMTLAAGTYNGQPVIIKRAGSATVTLTASIDGASRTITMSSSTAPYECLHLYWNASTATWDFR